MAKNTNAESDPARDLGLTNRALLPFLAAGAAIIFLRYLRVADIAPLAVALMWAASCLISGVIVGFIFCIPRVVEPERANQQDSAASGGTAGQSAAGLRANRAAAETRTRLQVNSNLVEISDWLTKIIVGLGLVNLKDIPAVLARSGQVLAGGLAQTPSCSAAVGCTHYAFAIALIVAFSILGFLMGYLYTRLFLMGAFDRADNVGRPAMALEERADEEIGKSDAPPSLTTSEAELATAARVKELPEAQDQSTAVVALEKLATDYELLRSDMDGGAERTRAMTQVLARMRALALTALEKLPRFAGSASAGERLVAIAMLQVKPDPNYIDWLIQRLTSEKPFVGYAATEALRRVEGVFTASAERATLTDRLQRFAATPEGQKFIRADNDRAALLLQVLRSLNIAVPEG